ncbi:AraC family transcriptional regulator [Microvirga ossetica]|uniref:AraC family transcriptional regulator n=1 Tax=Microvirga ossetica TaxID=1882682 RepID=UPI001F3FFAA4|nr:AraC family transcriptional regulator [Microvirga ossetica]
MQGVSLAMPPSATGAIARLAAARVTERGLDLAALLRKAGLTASQIQDRQARVAVAAQITFLNLAAEALRDDLLGFHLAQAFEPREIGLPYFVLASSATLGDAMARAERYSTITNEGIRLLCQAGSDFRIRYCYVGVSRHTDRHQLEFWATAFVRICRTLTDTDLRPVRVSLAHPRCGASGQLGAFFGCEVTFASEHDEITFAPGTPQLRLAEAERYLNEVLIQYCEEALSRRAKPAIPVRANVENAIAPLLPHGRARAGEVARALGMSERTLARRLAAENLTFFGIQEDMRQDLARHYLADVSLPVSRIAWLLGFQEVSAFTHAFKRWTGQTPTQMRSRIAAQATSGNVDF